MSKSKSSSKVFTKQYYCPECNNVFPVATGKRTGSSKIKAYCPYCNKKQELINRKAGFDFKR